MMSSQEALFVLLIVSCRFSALWQSRVPGLWLEEAKVCFGQGFGEMSGGGQQEYLSMEE